MKAFFIPAIAALALTACAVTPESEETAVNMVELRGNQLVRVTERGPNTIVCQDYWQQFTLWDRAVLWPDHMTSEDAQAICRSREQMMTEAPTNKPWEPVFNHKTNVHDQVLTDAANESVGRSDVQAR